MGDQQGRFVGYQTGAQAPVLYGGNTKQQNDLEWGRARITAGVIATQSGTGTFSVDVDGRLKFTYGTPLANPPFAQVSVSNNDVAQLLVPIKVRIDSDAAYFILYTLAGAEVLVAAMVDPEIQIHLYSIG